MTDNQLLARLAVALKRRNVLRYLKDRVTEAQSPEVRVYYLAGFSFYAKLCHQQGERS